MVILVNKNDYHEHHNLKIIGAKMKTLVTHRAHFGEHYWNPLVM